MADSITSSEIYIVFQHLICTMYDKFKTANSRSPDVNKTMSVYLEIYLLENKEKEKYRGLLNEWLGALLSKKLLRDKLEGVGFSIANRGENRQLKIPLQRDRGEVCGFVFSQVELDSFWPIPVKPPPATGTHSPILTLPYPYLYLYPSPPPPLTLTLSPMLGHRLSIFFDKPHS